MEIQRFLHILNPNSEHRPAVQKFFKKNNRLPHVWVDRTSHPTHLETIVEWGLLEGYTHFALWGGDGSHNRVVQSLHDQKKLASSYIALIPSGTGNDFARKLDLSPWKKNIDSVFSKNSTIKKFDLGLLSFNGKTRVFVNNAGFGRTVTNVKAARPNPISDIRSFKEKMVNVECDDGAAQHYETLKLIMMIVFNSPYFNKGLFFDKEISPDDGCLNAVAVPLQNESKLLWRFFKGRLGCSLSDRADHWVTGRRIAVESDQKLFPQVDGEAATTEGANSLEFSILKQSLNLIMPYRTY